jgi:hypothetical protein
MQQANKSSLDNVLKAVLAVSQEEQSFYYSPHIYTQHRNIIESLLLSALVKAFPANPIVIDQIAPFVKTQTIPVTNGYIQLPDDYRNILGNPVVFANKDSTGECGEVSEPLNIRNFQLGILKSGCRLNALTIVPQSEFADRTVSTYNTPSYENPIGYFMDNNKIKVCPFNLTKVGVMYARKERLLNYGHYSNPDDTYGYDQTTTIDSEFGSNAFEMIFNACIALYSAYAKDKELQSWAEVLKTQGIL